MRTSQRTGLWLLAGALLASVEFGYAHLQQVGLWPLQLIATSLWRLFGSHGNDAGSASSVWAPVLVLIAGGLLAEILAVWTRRRTSRREASEGDGHE